MRAVVISLFLVLLAAFSPPVCAGNVFECDVCVYGGTSGGAIAAVAAARLGKKVALVEVNNHVGGMSSSGLGVTDVGNAASIAGFAAEFYSRVGAAYGSTNPVYWFEPHVAEQTFMQMLAGAGVTIYTNEQLASVTMTNLTITQITMADGTVYQAKEFIDCTYEGDLMALSGVSYTWGREGTNVYGESLAGVFLNSVDFFVDPYVIPGNAASGVIPLIQTNVPGTIGAGDQRMQCYNFRLCLTQVATNQIPITAPTNYYETNYELLRRYIVAWNTAYGSNSVTLEDLINVQTIIPNNKTDINADNMVSTDHIGYNYTYPTNTYAGRQTLWQQHKDYITGLLYYLGHSTNVPLNVQTDMLSWGYAKDEFQDNGGWPYLMYVREARRMVSDYIMLQQDAQGLRAATDPIALGSYTLDCHPAAYLAVNGEATWEGSIGTSVPAPYPISYRSIIPSVGQCQNLFSTFALSASHVGYASIRLEPPFMMTSQSAGTAASFAIDDNVPVQSVNYQKLAAELVADGQLLNWGSVQSISSNGIIMTVNTTTGVTKVGSWSTGANSGGWPLPNGTYLLDGDTGGGKSIKFSPTITTNGYYDVYVWWVYASNRATNATFITTSGSGTTKVFINQQVNCTNWVKIAASNYFNIGTNGGVTITNGGANGYVVANAVRFMPLGSIAPNSPANLPTVAIVASDAATGEFGTNRGRFSLVNLGNSNGSPVTVNYTIGGTAINGVDYATLPGSVTLPANAIVTNLFITPLGDTLSANSATVTLTLSSSTNYNLTNLSSATVTILDRPLHSWLRANFTSSQLANPQISGDAATPAGDGLPNLVKYELGLSPFVSYSNVFNPAIANGHLELSCNQSLAATDAELIFQYSTDLTNWYSSPVYFQTLTNVFQGATEFFSLQTATPVLSNRTAFVRVAASRL